MSILLRTNPFFQVVSDDYYNQYQRQLARRRREAYEAFDTLTRAVDDIFSSPMVRTPSVNLTEEANEYVVEAELPGVKKEDLSVSVGEGGKSLTIEGKVFSRSGREPGEVTSAPAPTPAPAPTEATPEGGEGAKVAPAEQQQSTEVTSSDSAKEQAVTKAPTPEQESTYHSTFSRTFQFPRAVDGSRVSARLEHGLLTLRIPKMEDSKSVRVNID